MVCIFSGVTGVIAAVDVDVRIISSLWRNMERDMNWSVCCLALEIIDRVFA